MPRVEGYAYSDGTTKFAANNTLVVEESATSPLKTSCRLGSSLSFSDALDAWELLLFALTPAGVYELTYSATTRRVTFRTTNGVSFKPVWTYPDAARWLGFDPTAVYAFAQTHVGTAVPLGRVDLHAVDVEPPEDAARAELQRYRLGRAQAPFFGNHLLQSVAFLATAAQTPSSWAWLTSGRLRVYPTADVSPYSATNLDGYFDGWVVEQSVQERLGDLQELASVSLVLALPRLP